MIPDGTDTSQWIGHDDPSTRGLLQDMETAFIAGTPYTLTEKEVEAVYLMMARFHDLEDFGYLRDWEGIATYCPRLDDPDE